MALLQGCRGYYNAVRVGVAYKIIWPLHYQLPLRAAATKDFVHEPIIFTVFVFFFCRLPGPESADQTGLDGPFHDGGGELYECRRVAGWEDTRF
jgi:hypothetical protein